MVNNVPTRVELGDGLPVTIKAVLNSGKGKLLNLSSNGAFVVTEMFLLPQAQVQLKIILPEERRWVETEAVVVWENRGPAKRDDLPPGYGLRFLKIPEETVAMIREHLAVVPKTSPQSTSDSEMFSEQGAELEAAAELGGNEPEGPPYRLNEEVVHTHTPEGAKGIFVLSYDRTQEARVGRADEDLRTALENFIGEYAYFYYETIDGEDERFSRECELFHRLGGDRGQLDNHEHPESREGSNLSCPICSQT